jgi:4-aminobutyrate aminotransferase-like enzyme
MERCVVNSGTFAENDLAMAAGLATLHALDEERIIDRASRAGERLRQGLERLQSQSEFIKEVRGRGLMVAVEFGEPGSRLPKLGWKTAAGNAIEVLKFIPPLVVTDQQVDHLIESLGSVLRDAERFPGGLWDLAVRLARLATS